MRLLKRLVIAVLAGFLVVAVYVATHRSSGPPPKPAQLDEPTNQAMHELQKAAAQGDLARLNSLLQQQPQLVAWSNEEDIFPLHEALDAGQLEAARLLLEKGASPDRPRTRGGDRPLHCAQTPDAVSLLLGKQAQVNAPDGRGNTPLARAVWKNRVDLVQALLAAKADPNLVGKPRWPGKALDGRRWDRRWEHSPMHQAAEASREILELLVAAGGNVNLETDHATVLEVARDSGNRAAEALLLGKGAH